MSSFVFVNLTVENFVRKIVSPYEEHAESSYSIMNKVQ